MSKRVDAWLSFFVSFFTFFVSLFLSLLFFSFSFSFFLPIESICSHTQTFIPVFLLHDTSSPARQCLRAQELCESRGGCPGLPVPNSPYGLRGRKATLELRAQSSGVVNQSINQSINILFYICSHRVLGEIRQKRKTTTYDYDLY